MGGGGATVAARAAASRLQPSVWQGFMSADFQVSATRVPAWARPTRAAPALCLIPLRSVYGTMLESLWMPACGSREWQRGPRLKPSLDLRHNFVAVGPPLEQLQPHLAAPYDLRPARARAALSAPLLPRPGYDSSESETLTASDGAGVRRSQRSLFLSFSLSLPRRALCLSVAH
jgi:hypothetical protein